MASSSFWTLLTPCSLPAHRLPVTTCSLKLQSSDCFTFFSPALSKHQIELPQAVASLGHRHRKAASESPVLGPSRAVCWSLIQNWTTGDLELRSYLLGARFSPVRCRYYDPPQRLAVKIQTSSQQMQRVTVTVPWRELCRHHFSSQTVLCQPGKWQFFKRLHGFSFLYFTWGIISFFY